MVRRPEGCPRSRAVTGCACPGRERLMEQPVSSGNISSCETETQAGPERTNRLAGTLGRQELPEGRPRLRVRRRALQRARLHQGRDRQRVRRRQRAALTAGRQRGHVRRDRRRVQVHRREPRQVPRGRVPQQRRRRAERRAAGGVREVLQGRRRLPRHPLGDRGRAGLAVHDRRPRYTCRGPNRPARRDSQGRGPRARRQQGPAGVLDAQRPLVQLHRQRPRLLARPRDGRREHVRRRDGWLRPSDRLVQGLPGRP